MNTDFFQKTLDVLFPPHEDVVAARQISEDAILATLAVRKNGASSIYTGLSYRNESVRALIRANKFHRCRHSASVLAAALFEMLAQMLEERALEPAWKRPLLVPIPASEKRRRERGGNQVEWIIEAMPKETVRGFTYAPRLLSRRERPSQTRVPKHKRRENISGAFFVPRRGIGLRSIFLRSRTDLERSLSGASVIVVDDVSESGATMQDAMRALKAAGARRVIGIALAK